MLRMVELFVICVTLVATGNSAPWSENNELREYDLEWQCEQLCERLYGKSTYTEHNSTCSCSIDQDDPEINWMRIKNNAKNLGLILEIVNSHSKNIIKRETPAERLKKLIETKKQEKEENETIAKEAPKVDNLPASPEMERIKKLKELLQNKRQAKITANLEPPQMQNDEQIKPSPVKINLPVNIPKKIETDITENQETKKLSLIERLKSKNPTDTHEKTKSSHSKELEAYLEKRRKIREQLKARIQAARNRNKTPEVL